MGVTTALRAALGSMRDLTLSLTVELWEVVPLAALY